jgi:hypothetical protein
MVSKIRSFDRLGTLIQLWIAFDKELICADSRFLEASAAGYGPWPKPWPPAGPSGYRD